MPGYVIKLGGAPCVWASEKQAMDALSTCESEYHAMVAAAQEFVWIKRLFDERGRSSEFPTASWADNQSAIQLAIAERYPSGRAKHIDVNVHFIRRLIGQNMVDVKYVSTSTMTLLY